VVAGEWSTATASKHTVWGTDKALQLNNQIQARDYHHFYYRLYVLL
jgi:hypothetical protein